MLKEFTMQGYGTFKEVYLIQLVIQIMTMWDVKLIEKVQLEHATFYELHQYHGLEKSNHMFP